MATAEPQFISLTLETSAAVADDAAGLCVAAGALGCELKRLRRAGAAARVRLCVYFPYPDRGAARRTITRLRRARMLDEGASPLIGDLKDPGWATMWQQRFEPFAVGRLLIVPPWRRAANPRGPTIIIQPGQAFGTGHHASTFGTLRLIDGFCAKNSIERALDVGTGSGILAIAMCKLGAPRVIALDQDPVALENARENLMLNQVERAVRLSLAPLASIGGHFDLITANILSSVLIEMAPRLIARLREGGHLILAGILAREARTVATAYEPPLKLLRTRADGRWRAMLFQRL